ncbi:four helix bundle protein [Pedobacter psychrophilus]|uniref:Four helix bundle protein n=1 Tax=Pedobacter psychrophilus TaxID=1826909 RepID=A0A179DII2_9SPHI|nr:four helix bundle protein [Pedobacter psychrophilus]OAQ40253.1 four helix bundle protein [Pedobacter psychrophilus]
MSFNSLEDLEVYKRAFALSDEVWKEVGLWKDFFVRDTIGKQLVRAADSIDANIAEGYGRFHYKENKNFCYYSRGSLLETKGFIHKCKNRELINREKADQLINEIDQIHKMLNAYISYIGKKKQEI